jgi:hypothetical protein
MEWWSDAPTGLVDRWIDELMSTEDEQKVAKGAKGGKRTGVVELEWW